MGGHRTVFILLLSLWITMVAAEQSEETSIDNDETTELLSDIRFEATWRSMLSNSVKPLGYLDSING